MTSKNETDARLKERLKLALADMGLVESQDFFLESADSGSHYTSVQFFFSDAVTHAAVAAIYDAALALRGVWGVTVAAFNEEVDDWQLLLEISGGGLSYIGGGEAIHALVQQVYLEKASPFD